MEEEVGLGILEGLLRANLLEKHKWRTRKISWGHRQWGIVLGRCREISENWQGPGVLLLALAGLQVAFSTICWSRALALALPLGQGGEGGLRPLPLLDQHMFGPEDWG